MDEIIILKEHYSVLIDKLIKYGDSSNKHQIEKIKFILIKLSQLEPRVDSLDRI